MSSTVIDACELPPASARSPQKAALLSLIPGLGQLYNGEKRKGVLFLDATGVNLLLLLLIVFNEPIVRTVTSLCSHFHVKANVSIMEAVRHAHLGSPASWVLLGLMTLFGLYAVRDAYSFGVRSRRQIKYPNHWIGLTETSSGVYLAHFALLMGCLVMAACFSGKRPIERNYTVIEFVPEQAETVHTPPANTERLSVRDSIDSGRHDSWRPLIAPESASDPVQPSTASAAAPNPNNVRPQPAIDPIPGAPQPRLQQLVATTTPTVRATAVPSHLPANRPTAGDAIPKPAQAAPVVYMAGHTDNPALPAVRNPTHNDSPNAVPKGANKTPSSGGTIAAPGQAATIKNPSSIDQATPASVLPGGNPAGTTRTIDSPMPTVKPGNGTTMTGEKDNVVAPVSNDRGVLGNSSPTAVNGPDSIASRGIDPDFSAFMGKLQRIIKNHWYPPRSGSTNASVIFELRKNGAMHDLRISESSNNNAVDASALAAIRNASAYFPALPSSAPEAVDIEFTFEYNNLIRTYNGEDTY